MFFNLIKNLTYGKARLGELHTAHGVVNTPFFMTIATKAAVKSLGSMDLSLLNLPIILSNTYHLMLRPGMEIMKAAGGLHSFMRWDKPILTDSGGYQVFSLAKLRKMSEEGVRFQSHLDGSSHLLTPELAIEVQQTIGSDIMMCLDECTPYPCKREYALESLERTLRWAERCLRYKKENIEYKSNQNQFLFGIVQGGTFLDLRERSLRGLVSLDFDGYAIGGLAVGEPRESMYEVLSSCVGLLPENRPRYLMGVGYPEEIVQAVLFGIDMFDCVIPTREGRHGRLFHFIDGKSVFEQGFYEKVNVTRSEFATNFTPINAQSQIPELRLYTKAYLHHLFRTGEILGMRLATMNNVEFYQKLMGRIRFESA